ncbi:TspO/MBR family protein [Candidatus Enterococcus clewellii]|uniref:Translocator protein n=1 Tax=Candidatus Enterococcus clewellii TaxID=1834193 RepID=A0A242K760_9ENTE|nr:TspO/MBR family protein [Enterococcus sp. 9E7_DIV0242]OTP16044.1 hypothetical protein A5888_002258 [Enterococcus sp. 9E7_DIV0242]
MTIKRVLLFLACVIGVELTGSLSGFLTGDISGKYAEMVKPPFAPPGSLVGMVWIVLYFLMGVSLFLLLTAEQQKKDKQKAVGLFFIQLVINFIWSLIFFGGEYMWLGVIVCLLLDGFVLLSIVVFHKVRPWAAYLLIPYLIWISFATYLSIGLALLN